RGLETWCTFAFKLRDFAQISQALEARADSTSGSDAADLLVEASELARAAGDDVRSTTLLRKARGVDPGSSTARNALLALSTIPTRERIDLLQEEARHTGPEGRARAEAYGRAAEAAEWRVGDPLRAIDLYKAAAQQHPQSAFAWSHLARLLAWTEKPADAAEACERIAAVAQPLSERNEA